MIPLTNINITAELHYIAYFRGVFSRDTLPNKLNKKGCSVINYDSSGSPGTHWTCYFNDPKYLFIGFFDSYDFQP